MSTANSRKRGGKRKIPILAQDSMPVYEPSLKSDDLSELDDSISAEFSQNSPSTSSNILSSRENVLLPILKKRATIPLPNGEEVMMQEQPSTSSAAGDQDDDDDGFFNEDVSYLLGSVYSGGGDSQERIRERMDTAKERLRLAYPLLSPQQKERYDKFRQSALPRPWMQSFLGSSVNPNMVIIASGMSKVFIGELIEEALDIALKWGENNGPLLPSHIREAYRRILGDQGNLHPKSFVRNIRKGSLF